MHLNKIATIGVTASFSFILSAVLAESTEDNLNVGKELAFNSNKGNCLACHQIEGGESPGNIGPPLIAMQSRYPDVEKLRAQIWDAAVANPDTTMPPVGRHRILTEQEIDQVVEFIRSK